MGAPVVNLEVDLRRSGVLRCSFHDIGIKSFGFIWDGVAGWICCSMSSRIQISNEI